MVLVIGICLVVLLVAVVWAVIASAYSPDAVDQLVGRWHESHQEPTPLGPPIEQIASDLRRLLYEHDRLIRDSGQWHLAHHVRACELAIRDRAEEAARALDLPPGPCSGDSWTTADLAVRLQQLADAGLVLPENAGQL